MENIKDSDKDSADRRSSSWDIQNALPNYATLILSQGGIILFSFLNFWYLTRVLGPEGYGGVVALIAASQTAQIFVGWTNLALARLGVEEYVTTGKVDKTFWSKTAVSLGNVIFLLVLVPFWLSPLSTWLKIPSEVFPLIIFHFIVATFGLHIQHTLQAVKLLKLQNFFQLIERIVTFLSFLILFYSDRLTITSALLVYTISNLIASLLGFWKISPFITWRLIPDYEWVKKIIFFSLPLFPLSILGFLSANYLDVIFISSFLTIKDVGIYSTAYQFVGLATNFTTVANLLLMPMFVSLQSNQKDSAIETYLRQILPVIVTFWALYCTLLAVFGQYFLPLFFGEKFQEASPISYVLLSAAILNSPTLMGYSPLAIAKSMTRQLLIISLGTSSTNVLFNFLLIPRYGLIGCAWATVASAVIFSLLSMTVVHWRGKIPLSWSYRTVCATIIGASGILLSQKTLMGIVVMVVSVIGWTIYERKIIVHLIREPILNPIDKFRKRITGS